MSDAVDLLIQTENPEALDRIVQTFGAVLIGGNGNLLGYLMIDGCYVVRAFKNPDFLESVLETHGFGRVVRRQEVP